MTMTMEHEGATEEYAGVELRAYHGQDRALDQMCLSTWRSFEATLPVRCHSHAPWCCIP
jgi:hypothetical protein